MTAERQHGFKTRRADDVADQADSISGWQQEYVQVSAGAFQGRLDEVQREHWQVFHEYTSQATYQQCQPWAGSIWFGLSSAQYDEALWFNGRQQAAHTLLFTPAEHDFTLRTPDSFGIYGVVMELAHLTERCAELFACDLPRQWQQAGAVTLSPTLYARLSDTLTGLLSAARVQPDPHAQAHLVDALADEILLALLESSQNGDGLKPLSRSGQRQLEQIGQARMLALAPDNPATSVEALCERLHLTRRTLQNHFQEVAGLSPLAFIRSVRLNAFRRALRDPQQAHVPIQELAAHWHFWNLSALSYDYKRLFGESPSQTRQAAQMHRV